MVDLVALGNNNMEARREDVKTFIKVAHDARLDGDEVKKIYGEDTVIIDNKKTDTQGFMAIRDGALLISFRGSQETKDWINDFNAWHTVVPYGNYESDIRVHRGFLGCYKSVRGEILKHVGSLRDKITQIFVTGHSLGGALATLCAVDIQYNFGKCFKLDVYTTGAPSVGNKAFARSYNNRVPDTTRTYIRSDVVPKLPPWWFGFLIHGGYKHVEVSNPIGPRDFWTGLRYFFKVKKKFAENVTNHSIDLYLKYC